MPDHAPLERLDAPWLALVIGNTRLHWARFQGHHIVAAWHTSHLSPNIAEMLIQQQFSAKAWQTVTTLIPMDLSPLNWPQTERLHGNQPMALYCASVVPQQTTLWQTYLHFHEVRLTHLALANAYPTLGIDRALNVLGGGDRYGWPILVIDAGTALTFTAGNAGRLIGGAILPGLSTQFATLSQHTVTLPAIQAQPSMPPRWSTTTANAIRSGIIYGMLATIRDFLRAWHTQYPGGQAVLTGGDAYQIGKWLISPPAPLTLYQDPDLTFWGLCYYRQQRLTTNH